MNYSGNKPIFTDFRHLSLFSDEMGFILSCMGLKSLPPEMLTFRPFKTIFFYHIYELFHSSLNSKSSSMSSIHQPDNSTLQHKKLAPDKKTGNAKVNADVTQNAPKYTSSQKSRTTSTQCGGEGESQCEIRYREDNKPPSTTSKIEDEGGGCKGLDVRGEGEQQQTSRRTLDNHENLDNIKKPGNNRDRRRRGSNASEIDAGVDNSVKRRERQIDKKRERRKERKEWIERSLNL